MGEPGITPEDLLGPRVWVGHGEPGRVGWLQKGPGWHNAEDLWWQVNGEGGGVKAVHCSQCAGYDGQDFLACASLSIRRLLCTVIC